MLLTHSVFLVHQIEYPYRLLLWLLRFVGVAYLTELFIAYYSGVIWEQEAFRLRVLGPYWWAYWGMMLCNVVSPQLFWFKKLRRNVWFTFFMSIIVNIGMWFERFVIIMSLHRDYLPSSWSYYTPSWTEVAFYLGSFGLFFTCYFLFAKYFPVIAIAEIKFILKTSGDNYKKEMVKYEHQDNEVFLAEQSHHH